MLDFAWVNKTLVLVVALVTLTVGTVSVALSQERTDDRADEGSPIRGVIRAVDEAVLSTDLVARVVRLPLREGDRFSEGDLLIEFDCSRQEAEAAAAWQSHAARKRIFQTNRRLIAQDALGADEFEISRAEMKRAGAEARAATARGKDCKMLAPFNGRIVARMINRYEMSRPGEPLLQIVDDTALEVELLVPSRWLAWLEPNVAFRFDVDETGRSYSAFVSRHGGVVDPVSQTLKVFGRLAERPPELLSGMSGTAFFAARRASITRSPWALVQWPAEALLSGL